MSIELIFAMENPKTIESLNGIKNGEHGEVFV